jgi:hypothetical protein
MKRDKFLKIKIWLQFELLGKSTVGYVNSWQRSRTPSDARKVKNVKTVRLQQQLEMERVAYLIEKGEKPIRLNLNLFWNSFLSLLFF